MRVLVAFFKQIFIEVIGNFYYSKSLTHFKICLPHKTLIIFEILSFIYKNDGQIN